MITRRESKIKPFIIESSWRGKIFSPQQSTKDKSRTWRKLILSLVKLILLNELQTLFRSSKQIKEDCHQLNILKTQNFRMNSTGKFLDGFCFYQSPSQSLFTPKEVFIAKSFAITYRLICMHHLLKWHQQLFMHPRKLSRVAVQTTNMP